MTRKTKVKRHKRQKWRKNIIFDYGKDLGVRYEWVKGKYTIDVLIGSRRAQGKPGANQVNVFSKDYGGWLLGTPKNLPNVGAVKRFIASSIRRLEKGDEGRKVPFRLF